MSGKKQYRLLMIDDDRSLGELLVAYFERFGHKLTAATTAADGRYLLRRDDPDLLILDVMLPDADGMELCKTIRSESDIPIVPTASPAMPPSTQISTASVKNCSRMSRGRPPTASRSPISE